MDFPSRTPVAVGSWVFVFGVFVVDAEEDRKQSSVFTHKWCSYYATAVVKLDKQTKVGKNTATGVQTLLTTIFEKLLTKSRWWWCWRLRPLLGILHSKSTK